LQIDPPSHFGCSHSGQTFGVACICSRADPAKLFRPISSFDETIVLSHIAADSNGGIFWGAFSVQGGAQTPQGSKSGCRRGPIRVPTDIYSSIETRVHLLEQFQAHSDGGFFRSGFPAGSGYRISPESPIFSDLSVHASDLLSSYDHGYFLLFYCIPVQIQEILLTSRFYISSRLLYFHA
jgi:hypothetical protein